MSYLIESGLLDLVGGILLVLFAYLLPGIYMTYDHREGLKLLWTREMARRQIYKHPVWFVYFVAVICWPFIDWERVMVHQRWAETIKLQKEKDEKIPDSDNME